MDIREEPRRKNIEKNRKMWFFSKKIDIFARKIQTPSKLDQKSISPTQIDPRGHVGARNSEIRSYWSVHVSKIRWKLVIAVSIFLLSALAKWASDQNWSKFIVFLNLRSWIVSLWPLGIVFDRLESKKSKKYARSVTVWSAIFCSFRDFSDFYRCSPHWKQVKIFTFCEFVELIQGRVIKNPQKSVLLLRDTTTDEPRLILLRIWKIQTFENA